MANRIHSVLNDSGGTQHSILIRQILSRCEIDLGNIKIEYEEIFGKPLRKIVETKTTGDYRSALLSLVDGNYKAPEPERQKVVRKPAAPKLKPKPEPAKPKPVEKPVPKPKAKPVKKSEPAKTSKKGSGIQPTLVPEPKFDVDKDCETLMKAMKGLGTDEDSLTKVLTRRSFNQRLQIMNQYKKKYEKVSGFLGILE